MSATRIHHDRTSSISVLLGVLVAGGVVAGFLYYTHAQTLKKKTQPFSYLKAVPSDTVLRAKLTEDQYRVTRQNGTETAFRNDYWDNQRAGIYVDVITGDPLFCSTDKYDAGTGRPTFGKPIYADSVFERPDTSFNMNRIEVRATKSNSHLGHLFSDPKSPTGRRYAVSSAAFHFIAADKMEAEGYAKFIPLLSGGAASSPQPSAATQ